MVAPLVGAWIETDEEYEKRKRENVAPLVGAWIETSQSGERLGSYAVAPLVGAWIETIPKASEQWRYPSRTPRGCVD